MGEYYHTMQFMQESFAEITKQKVPYLGFNGNPIPQQYASSGLTGNAPVFDALAESYGWMETSPYYQKYLKKHVIEESGGVHDVITPRGYRPENLMSGSGVFGGISMNTPSSVYKTPTFNPVTITDPRLRR